MRISIAVLAVFSVLCAWPVARSGARPQNGVQCCKLVEDAIDDSRHVKPGISRRELEKDWRVDGGLSVREEANYDYRKCLDIKIHVNFKPVPSQQRAGEEPDQNDIVIKVSRPYLEYAFAD